MPHASVNGVRLYYEVEGEGEPVVLLHAVGLDVTCWEGQVKAFAARRRVLRLDLRGHGRSDVPSPPYTLAGFADDVHALLRELTLTPAHVVGLSLGGMVAQVLALDHQEVVRSLVLADTVSTLPAEARPGMIERGEAAKRGGMAAIIDETLARWFTPGFMDSEVVARCRQRLLSDSLTGWAAAWHAISELELESRLPEIRVPTLVITGEADVAAPVARAQAMAARIPGARCEIIPGAPHMAPLERPDLFNAALLRFWRGAAGEV